MLRLGIQPSNPDLLYAFVTTGPGSLQGVYRLDGVTQAWKSVSAVPNVLPGGQGAYDLTIAVDPADANLIYLGGDRMETPHGEDRFGAAVSSPAAPPIE